MSLFVEVEALQRRKRGEDICGDAFVSRKLPAENRVIAVLSDGLGSGVKANVLASMTAAMAVRFAASNMDFTRSAEIMMDALPVCQVRRISYATFTIVDTRLSGGTRIIEMGNPGFMLVRDGRVVEVETRQTHSPRWADRSMLYADLDTQAEDRLIVLSDGITQAGMGSSEYKLGWRREGCARFVEQRVRETPGLSARQLAREIVSQALLCSPSHQPADDMTCGVIYFRRPRRLLVLTGPPFHKASDLECATLIRDFEGRKAICGGTTATIVARELGREISTQLRQATHDLPAISTMPGVDLVTEGILSLTRTAQYLEAEEPVNAQDAAARLMKLLLDSDVIQFVVGTRVNEAHQDPSLPIDLDIRRNIIKRLAQTLRARYLKEIDIRYI